MDKDRNALFERLRHRLEVAGGDPARWPDGERDDLLAFIGRDDAARALWQEAKALDRLLDRAAPPAPDAARMERLGGRILAGFDAGAAAQNSGVILAFPGRKAPFVASRGRGLAAAAMAASLCIGVYLGSFGIGGWTLDPVETLAGLPVDEDRVADLGEFIVDDDEMGDLL